MAAFDIDEYMENIEQMDMIKKIKLDPLKIQPTDLEKVTADTKIIQIKLCIKGVIDKYIDWDLEDDQTRPIDVATEVAERLDFKDDEERERIIKQLEDIICKEIIRTVDTSLSQQASIARKKKITPSTIACPSCDSLFKPEDENCKQCGFLLKKKQTDSNKYNFKSLANTGIIGMGDDAYQLHRSNSATTTRQNRIKKNKLDKLTKTRSKQHKTKPFLTDNKYCCNFWSIITKDPLILSLEGLEDMVTEEDATCLRDLYTKLKEIFSNNPEYIFDIDYQQTRDIHYLLDKTYEELLTDNSVTDNIFKEAQTKSYILEEPLLWKNVLEEPHYPEQPVFRYRPYNMESKAFHNIVYNQNIISNIDYDHCHIEEVKDLIEANANFAEFLAEKYNAGPNKKGRPKKHDYITEDMMTINSVNDLIPILQQQAQTREPAIRERVAVKKISTAAKPKKFAPKCTLCFKRGKLLSCENCPVAYHPTCMGYDSSFPRRKWKCYFCKVIKYGLKANLTKIAPNESQWCKVFLTLQKAHWKEVALHLMNVLKEYPASKTFWYSEKRESKEYKQKQTYPMNMSKIKRKLEHDLELQKAEKTELDKDEETKSTSEKYKKLDDFLKDLFTVFRNTELFIEPTKKKYKYSQACQKFVMHMLEKENIFHTFAEIAQPSPEDEAAIDQTVENEGDNEDENDEGEENYEDLDLEEREKLMDDQLESEEDEEESSMMMRDDETYQEKTSRQYSYNPPVELTKEERDEEYQEKGFVRRAPGKK